MKPSFNDTIELRLRTKSNNRTRGQFECDVTFFCLISFVHMYGAVVVP